MSVCRQGLRLVSLTMAALVLGLAATTSADTIYVCWDGSGDYLTIQEGITAAADGDEVVVCDGTYTGPLNKNLDFAGKAITVRSENGPENCVIDCENDGRGFHFHSGETTAAVLDGLTVQNGFVVEANGGGILCEASSPTIRNCTFNGSTATGSTQSSGNGGGISCLGLASRPTIEDCSFNGNTAANNGGGVCCGLFSSPNLTDCMFGNNSAALGGGMTNTNQSSPTVTDCTFSGNLATFGGGMSNRLNSNPVILNCAFSGNSAGDGGGMANSNQSNPTVINCTFGGNTADSDGGGIHNLETANPTLINSTFSVNAAGNRGGGIANFDSNPELVNCTFSGNTALTGGGIRDENGGLVVVNCILWGNAPSQISAFLPQAVTVTYCDVQGGWHGGGGEGNIDADPLFVDPDGPDDDPETWEDNDYHISPRSPCIDAADNEAVPADEFDLDEDGDTDEPLPFDLDGNPRFVDDPDTDDTGHGTKPIVDMGAYEYQPCVGDLDGDGITSHSDLGILLGDWGCVGSEPEDCPGDLDGDFDTDHADLGILLADWGCGVQP